ncbi:N-6 DNA methylase [Capnocytophaga felis]|uniref:Restriction endonuclease subunit M n=1 Tax=Capnocytophaga felis TaxID=2267611 RepID=A0A5M4B835_9FLAO|nr:N-6 DNA methylase [Capnocytophaga felis]GET45455.1 restriction endonuclease subunit M [Capnocytophaga felis]GET47382.1 restriction endonuclease subunit M [Capnocytophaga felis]
MKLIEILKDTNYKLTQFSEEHIADFEKNIIVKEIKGKPTPYVACAIRNKEIKLTPEEVVRQLYVNLLMQDFNYPKDRIVLEYEVTFGREKKRADIVILDKDNITSPYIIVEVKKPKLKDGKEQLRSYCNATGAPIGVWTNGDSISYYHRKDPNYFEDISHIPSVYQKLSDILNERYTIEDLIKKDKLVNERKSLKDLILEMEDEVLANAGVDVFEELFKLIFTKLFDEMQSGRNKSRFLEFRNSGDTETELKNKIQKLFDQAKSKWEGVFSDDSKIQLTPSHLSVCVSSLQDVKLFNSNLDVVDEAFEYLINKSSKGEKGQYFTPRYVIDMCVKMLNPQRHETIIDTASGSCGFPVHSIFYVWEQILKEKGLSKSHLFTLEDKPQECTDYVVDKVFAIDFDERAVRVARTLNLIAGDGQTNVLHINTLDWERWDEKTSDEDWIDTYNEGWKKLKKLREDKNSNRDFQFDILMANPPFAGDIKESRILAKYDLGKKSDGKSQNKVGRDILFIERNLDFLKEGGRMAIVLPQGRFNNSSDKAIREFIAEHCRILAVVGLHGNVFKPHTGTKTSVLFVQKWDDELCPKVEDYPIFFATMQEPSKDNSGEKIYVTQRFIRYFENGEIAELLEEDYIQKYGSIEENTLWLPRIYAKNIGKISNKSNALELGAINNIEYKLLDEEEQKNYVNLFTPILETRYKLDSHGHLIVKHDLFNHDGLTQDGIAEAFIEFAKKEKLSFVGKN